jgi:hypothetical protein
MEGQGIRTWFQAGPRYFFLLTEFRPVYRGYSGKGEDDLQVLYTTTVPNVLVCFYSVINTFLSLLQI